MLLKYLKFLLYLMYGALCVYNMKAYIAIYLCFTPKKDTVTQKN